MKSTMIATRILLALGAAGSLAACSSDDTSTSSAASTEATGQGGAGANSSGSPASGATGTGGTQATGGAGGMQATGGTGGLMGAGGAAGHGTGSTTGPGNPNGGGPGQGGLPCPRRPFLVDSQPRAAEPMDRADWIDRLGKEGAPLDLDATTARALGMAWLEDGLTEHASIAAFARFTMLLVGVGAPPDFVRGSQRAGMDEVAHACGCFALARRYAGSTRPRGPSAVSLDGVLDRDPTLAEVAALTVHEGCVGETLGVLLATEQREHASDPAVRALLDRVVRDEMRHAELAWKFTQWAVEHGGHEVRQAVERAFAEAASATVAMSFVDEAGVDPAKWREHGRLTAAETRDIAARGLSEIVQPCAMALLGTRSNRDPLGIVASEEAGTSLSS